MKNIVLTRIDDRFMHGQVVVSWIPYLKADEVIIIDDEYANDDFMKLLIENAAPENVRVHVFNFNQAAAYLNEKDEGTKILILLKNITYIKKLLEQNIKLNKINVGNLGSSAERKKYYNSVYLSDDELSMLKEARKHSEVEIKMLPNDKALTLD
ncbi:MAG: PTS sugar transporter subunit IIB [Sedimentibacter sp.]